MKLGTTAAEFASAHTKLLMSTLGPVAKEAGCKALSNKLSDVIREERRNNPDLAMLSDNLAQVQEEQKGSIKLQDVYALNTRLVQEECEQAAKAAGGALNADSARFLPHHLQADFARLTGEPPTDAPGTAVAGVTLKTEGNNTQVNIDFETALAGVTSKDPVLALTDSVVLRASRYEGVADPNIPPYAIVISPREGKLAGDTWLVNEGSRSFSNPDSGHLIRAGSTEIQLVQGNDKKPFQTLTFALDKVNDYGAISKPPSPQTEGTRTSWERRFQDGQFDFAADVESGKLEPKTLAEVRSLRGVKVLLSAIRENSGQSITKLDKQGLLEFAVDKETNSLGVLRRLDGASEHFLSIVDLNQGRWVGTFAAGDDGTMEWQER
jgi:hypothetical protein